MVAIIKCSTSIARTLNYNEHKCKKGEAQLLDASGFLKGKDHLNFYEKMKRFNDLTALNQRTSVNGLHVSLNFHPNERLTEDEYRQIAAVYMHQIGFGEQPYLVYRHDDAAHPHLHIVSTNIQEHGKAISMHNVGRLKSEPARKKIERDFGLQPAEGRTKKLKQLICRPASPVIYGRSEVRRSIQNVLEEVITRYSFSTIGEFNALLGLYNVTAERGEKDSAMYRRQGLVYRLVQEGKPVGPPIKASSFYMRPTLNLLEKKFTADAFRKDKLKAPLSSRIAKVLAKESRLETFISSLKKVGIDTVCRHTDGGRIYGVTYVDHVNKVVFNGSTLGKEFSANAIQERFNGSRPIQKRAHEPECTSVDNISIGYESGLLERLIQEEFNPQPLPYFLRRKKRKRKRL